MSIQAKHVVVPITQTHRYVSTLLLHYVQASWPIMSAQNFTLKFPKNERFQLKNLRIL